ncbi:MAG: hypothetical protein PEPC_01266 [Peptostreptococcus russellii]
MTNEEDKKYKLINSLNIILKSGEYKNKVSFLVQL